MRRIPVVSNNSGNACVRRVVTFESIAADWQPEQRYLVLVSSELEQARVEELGAAGLDVEWALDAQGLQQNDVVAFDGSAAKRCVVLFRESDLHHTLQLTNRCNSNCLMCSQPPTPQEDHWRVEESLQVVQHMTNAPVAIGLTGGEPTLDPLSLRRVISEIHHRFPNTKIEVLTNGRTLGDSHLGPLILNDLPRGRVTWLVPLYGHADFLHDFIVQSPGAFDETIGGLLRLREFEQSIQLRIVLVKPVLEYLPQLCEFSVRKRSGADGL